MVRSYLQIYLFTNIFIYSYHLTAHTSNNNQSEFISYILSRVTNHRIRSDVRQSKRYPTNHSSLAVAKYLARDAYITRRSIVHVHILVYLFPRARKRLLRFKASYKVTSTRTPAKIIANRTLSLLVGETRLTTRRVPFSHLSRRANVNQPATVNVVTWPC